MAQKTLSRIKKMKIFYSPEMEDQPFPEKQSYLLLVEKPEALEDINETEGDKLEGIEGGAMNLSLHDSDDLAEGLTNKYLLDLAVTEIKLAALAISKAKIQVDAIYGDVIKAAAITETKIGTDAVSSAKIQASAIIAGKIATGAVIAEKILAGAVTTDKIYAGAVIAAKINVSQLSAISANIGTITAGTITGLIIRTAVSGQRVTMEGALGALPHILGFYNLNDVETLHIFGAPAETVIKGNLDIRPACFQGPLGHYSLKIYETKVLSEHFQPVAANKDIGLVGNKWRHLHLSGNAYVGGNLEVIGKVISDLVPSVDGSYDLGAPSFGWHKLELQYGANSYISQGGYTRFKFNANGGVIQIGRSLYPLVDNGYNLGAPTFGWRALYLTGAVDSFIYRGSDIHLELEAANLKCHRNFVTSVTSLNLGSAGEYWNEVHYHSLVSHTPKVLSKGLSLLETIQKKEDGKIDETKLASSLKHKKGGILMDNLIMANIAATKELNNRLKKLE